MNRLAVFALLLTGCGGAGCGHVNAPQEQPAIEQPEFVHVPEHAHAVVENTSCNLSCGGGVCTSAYDAKVGKYVSCWDKTADVCICQPPPEED